MTRRYLAVVDCSEGWGMFGGGWERRFRPVTMGTYGSYGEAYREANDACARSPRDCRNPRVEAQNG